MAQTKAKSKPKAKARSSKPKATKAKAKSPRAPKASHASNGHKASHNGKVKAVTEMASKAKLPLVAGGAALAGAAGGVALAASKRARKSAIEAAMQRRPKIKLDSSDVARAAKEVGNFSAQVGELASELQRNREAAHGSGGGHRSPVEVVLQGLTSRR
jgi:hypothetical protein